MNKLLKTFGAFVIALGIFGMAKVNAAEPTLTINTDDTTLEKGSTFTVSINAISDDGINGLTGRITYDTDVLEYVSKSLEVNEDFKDMGVFPEIAVISNGADIKNSEICTMEFKVKEDTTATEANIVLTKSQETGKLLLSLMPPAEDEEFSNQTLTITIQNSSLPDVPDYPTDPITEKTLSRIQITNQPTKTSYKIGETFDTTGMKVVAVYDDGTQQEVTNYTYSPSGRLTVDDKKVIITYVEGNIEKTAEVNISVSTTGSDSSEGNLPLTGLEDTRIYIAIAGIMLVTSFAGLRKYRGI